MAKDVDLTKELDEIVLELFVDSGSVQTEVARDFSKVLIDKTEAEAYDKIKMIT